MTLALLGAMTAPATPHAARPAPAAHTSQSSDAYPAGQLTTADRASSAGPTLTNDARQPRGGSEQQLPLGIALMGLGVLGLAVGLATLLTTRREPPAPPDARSIAAQPDGCPAGAVSPEKVSGGHVAAAGDGAGMAEPGKESTGVSPRGQTVAGLGGLARVRGRWSAVLTGAVVALLLALGFGLSARDAFGQSAQDFADWTSSSGNVAAGTLHGSSISLSGTNVSSTPASIVDGSS
ncbi:MAG: hypothetical protein M3N47_02320, partial [Chloroflexota bacterium]|nr:hypothetical protein [Chloroflexota bacterium]